MVTRNPYIAQLKAGYLFPEIKKRKAAYLEKNPHAKLIDLGIGDTSQPVPSHLTAGLTKGAVGLGTLAKYKGYGEEQGDGCLRRAIASRLYSRIIDADDIFISDGAKCDIGRLQLLFGEEAIIAVQDPTYPVYPDTSLISGKKKILSMPCRPENDFFPDLSKINEVDIIYFCSPNNPTGAVATHEQLTKLVKFAQEKRAIIIHDAAYAPFIQGDELPRSIYEVEGAETVAIEVGSFSKMAGFTGVRLGWSVVPQKLQFDDGTSIRSDWKRVISTFFNGASNIAQQGGIAALDDKGSEQIRETVAFYLQNVTILKKALEECRFELYGGSHAPFLWVKIPEMDSWEAFAFLLENQQLVTTPGVGFGSAGEGFIRLSAFGYRADIEEAAQRLTQLGENHEYNQKRAIHSGIS